jgi:hypothetical protein
VHARSEGVDRLHAGGVPNPQAFKDGTKTVADGKNQDSPKEHFDYFATRASGSS